MEPIQKDAFKPLFNKKEETYTACYCEENVYLLCRKFEAQLLSSIADSECYAVFVTNPMRQTYIECQQKGDPKSKNLVIWDYHVIFVQKVLSSNKCYVYDFDSTLPFPTAFDNYFLNSIFKKYPSQALQTMYRVVSSKALISHFGSTRDHMVKKVIKGVKLYNSPPPSYPPIVSSNGDADTLFKFYLEVNERNQEWAEDFMNETQLNMFFKAKKVMVKDIGEVKQITEQKEEQGKVETK